MTHNELVPQLQDPCKRRLNWDNLAQGLFLFTLGLSKKVLIADNFGNGVNYGFSHLAELNTNSALLVMLSYTIQIYFDFSGYCDMAMGMAKMMNIDLPLNFDAPYKSCTIVEFWERWHMTLTRFFTRYVYIPLGGNRKGPKSMYINTMIVFLVSGLWHGAGWTFVFWGGIHGLFVVITKRFKAFFARIPRPVNWVLTFLFVNVAWVFFRAETFADATQLLQTILCWEFGEFPYHLADCYFLQEMKFLLRGAAVFGLVPADLMLSPLWLTGFAMLLLLIPKTAKTCADRFSPTVWRCLATMILLTWNIFSFSGVSTFLYFNF